MDIKTVFVRCKVSQGTFDTEYFVILDSTSAYVDRDDVKVQSAPTRGSEVDGSVRAYLIQETENKFLVELTGQAVVGGLRTWIPRTQLAR
jgi:phosphoserine aminotransferase